MSRPADPVCIDLVSEPVGWITASRMPDTMVHNGKASPTLGSDWSINMHR
jgi:hypothetical protein